MNWILTGSSNRMSKGDCSTTDVHLVRIDTETFVDGQRLGGECFVQFEQIDLLQLPSGFVQLLVEKLLIGF